MTAPYPGWRSRVYCCCCSHRGTKGEGRPPPVAGPIMCAPQARPALFQARGRPFMPGPGKAVRVLTAPPGHRSRLAGNANRCNRWRDGESIGPGAGAGKTSAAVRCFCWGNGRGLPRFSRWSHAVTPLCRLRRHLPLKGGDRPPAGCRPEGWLGRRLRMDGRRRMGGAGGYVLARAVTPPLCRLRRHLPLKGGDWSLAALPA